MRFECCTTKAVDTNSEYVIYFFPTTTVVMANMPQYYVVCTLPIFLKVLFISTLLYRSPLL